MKNGLWSINGSAIVGSILTAVIIAILTGLLGVVNQPSFNLFAADWASIFKSMVNVGFIALIGALAHNFASDNNDKFLGRG